MARPVKQFLWDQWRQRIERQRTSGRSIAEFCRMENVAPQTFYAWKRKLSDVAAHRRPARSGGAEQSRGRIVVGAARSAPRQAVAGHGLPLRAGEFLQLPVSAAQVSPWIELALADGTILRLPQHNLAALVAVLRVLRGERLDLAETEGGHA